MSKQVRVLAISGAVSLMTGVCQLQQPERPNGKVTLVYTDGTRETGKWAGTLSEDTDIFAVVGAVQFQRKQAATK